MDPLRKGASRRLAARRWRLLASSLAVVLAAAPASAARQPGKDGALTAVAADTVVNAYARVTVDAAVASTTLTLGVPAGSCTLAPATLTANDLLLVIQMQGATISTADDATYGAVTSLNGAGSFELVTVRSVAGSVVTIDETGLRYAYVAGGNVQVVRVPQFSTLAVNAGASVVPAGWDGQCGGVVAIDVQGAATVNGTIDATGRGFRGGALDANSDNSGIDVPGYRSTLDTAGAEKGEGIAGAAAVYDSLFGGRYGRGAPANGGGGANSHNAAGGGGANATNGIAWNGQGNPDLSVAAWVTAWNLDTTFPLFATPGSAVTSSGGGRGGYSFSQANQDAFVFAPGDTNWNGNNRRERGGLGGRPLVNDPPSGRLFMGGGGGAGDQNNGFGGAGGNGGGILVLSALSVSGAGELAADGGVGGGTVGQNRDGAGGGGGGGSIVVRAGSVAGVTIRASGGVGGPQSLPQQQNEAEGPGGGGGGGYVRVEAGSMTVSPTAAGGANGTTASPALAEFPPNGSTGGGAGQVVLFVTAVELMSFEATGLAGAVSLQWQTASELSNLGFHLHRSSSADGPWTRITASLIPGLGSSPVGASYSYLDGGLVPGQRYYYKLEDIDTRSVSTFHGPVWTVPSPPAEDGGVDGGGDGAERDNDSVGDGSEESPEESCPAWVLASHGDASSPVRCTPHGDPDSVSFQVLSRTSRSVELELRTGGFWSVVPRGAGSPGPEGSAGVRAYARGFDTPTDPGALALPLRRALVDAVVGKQVRLASVEAFDEQRFRGLRPSAVGAMDLAASRDGTVRPVRRSPGASRLSAGYSPAALARLVGTVFQGEKKSAVLKLTPLRYDGGSGDLVLSGRVRVRLLFAGVEPGETGTGSTGRRARVAASDDVLAQLYTARRGLHGVRFEEVFPGRMRGMGTTLLRLQREGEAVRYRVEPRPEVFGPGSVLYFHVEREARSTDFTGEVAYELVRSGDGERMGTTLGAPEGPTVTTAPLGLVTQEVNRIYQSGLLEAEDLWQWEALPSPSTRTKSFTLEGVDEAGSGRVVVFLQGASESGTVVDHHVRVVVNGTEVGEASFAGKGPYRLEASVAASVLKEGSNTLEVANVGDTGVTSLFFLDRFEVRPPRKPQASEGALEGQWNESGTVEVGGFSGPVFVVDETGGDGEAGPTWLTGVGRTRRGGARFRAEAGHRYVVASNEGLLRPRVVRKEASALRSVENEADYLLIGPGTFLAAADPLLTHRESQGLVTKAVSLEEVAQEFGHGTASGEAIRSFVSYAYHSWTKPSPRYVVLLGDATYDPRRFSSTTTQESPMPALWGKTSYLWTALDPVMGAVNGEDDVPDVAVGRIPATTVEEAERLIGKLLAWEASGQGIEGKALLVADNPDAAGDFEGDVEDIRASYLGGRETEVLKVGQLGASTRPAIQAALDGGLSLVSYVGHGGSAVWASENVWNSWDAPSLRAQSRQPLLLTMNCLNGYFVGTNFESLSESLVKAEGRGVIAAFSPSGLSVDGPAHQYHRALMGELTGGTHQRLGDAVLAAQAAYAETGLLPELLSIYHLFGDPATRIR